ncbi:MAG: cobalamin-dependent protein [Nanoarchaeota archaeon]|nr:cobalamin-dependent protein [Nanoarchaeota archaeon]
MTDIILWNSLASRRRSVSDCFKENGLAQIKTYLEINNYDVQLIDWAIPSFYNKLSPDFLTKINREIISYLFENMEKNNENFKIKLIGIFNLFIQGILTYIQKKRMNYFLNELAKKIAKENILAFGVKVWYGEAFYWANKLIEKINKLNPEIITIAGGYHPTIYEDDFLKYSKFDLAVVTQGEYVLKKILDIIKTNKNKSKNKILIEISKKAEDGNLKNLIYRDNDLIKKTGKMLPNIKNNVIPDYRENDGKMNVHVMVESYGCDYGKCNFCVHPFIYPWYLVRPVSELVKEIKIMLKKGIGLFRFAGSDTPPQVGAIIADAILKNKLKLEYSIGSRAIRNSKNSKVYKKLVFCYKKMINSGLKSVFIGGETGNDLINEKIMNKGVNSEDIVYTVKAMREAEKLTGKKIDIILALIYPVPLIKGVSLDDVRKDNIKLIKTTAPNSVMITPPGPFKNTKWFFEKEKFGFKFGKNIIKNMMSYEYVLYKPPTLWPDLEFSLNNKKFIILLEECNELRNQIKEISVPTDVSDEHFLMLRAAGFLGEKGVKEFKKESIKDIVSSNYGWTNKICEKVDKYSNKLAKSNKL